MATYLLAASQSAAASFSAWAARIQRSLDAAMARAEMPDTRQPGGVSTGLGIGLIIAIAAGVVLLCLLPICVIAILTLLGPAIGNVFSDINSTI